MSVRPQYQHAVAHGVQNAFQLGGLVRGGTHMFLDIFGHAVDRVGQGREFTARNAPQAALEIAQGNGLHHADHLAEGTAQRAGQQHGQQQGKGHGDQADLAEHREAAFNLALQIFQGHGQPQQAAVVQAGHGIGQGQIQSAAGPDGEALTAALSIRAAPSGKGLAYFRPVRVIVQPVHGLGSHGCVGQHVALAVQQGKALVRQVQNAGQFRQSVRIGPQLVQNHTRQAGFMQQAFAGGLQLAVFQPAFAVKHGNADGEQRHRQHAAKNPGTKGKHELTPPMVVFGTLPEPTLSRGAIP